MPRRHDESPRGQNPNTRPQSRAHGKVPCQFGTKPVSHHSLAGHVLNDLSLDLSGVHQSLYPDPIAEIPEGRDSPAESRTASPIQRLQVSAAEEAGPEDVHRPQGVPSELRNLAFELGFISICSASLMTYSFLLGDVTVNQAEFKKALHISNSNLPWLVGSYTMANGLALVVSGSIMDLTPPKPLMVGAFAWLTVWHIVGFFSIEPSRTVLFFIVRAMQGLAIGVLISGSMSLMGRIYKPGIRKNRVFSAMAATAPFGYWLGAIQGGAMHDLRWIFGSNAVISAVCCVITYVAIPSLRPVADIVGIEAPSLRQFDYLGAGVAVTSCVLLLFGLTQGSATKWEPYTYCLVVVGLILLVAFFFIESKVQRPLIPTRLWKTKGFTPLMIAYFLGFGCYSGSWQFYAVQFWLRIQNVSPMSASLYLLPNAIVGALATFVVARTLHIFPGHYIYVASMFAYALGPVFFLPQTPGTSYWALSMPGVALVTFGPDLAFAAASIFITSSVARSYQGSAGSLLMVMQNLSAAIVTSVADAIGTKVDLEPSGDIGLSGLRAIWWFGLAGAILAAIITIIWVRIPKEVEKEHIT